MNTQQFEEYWLANRDKILSQNEDYKKAKNSYKMTSGADWLLFAIPVVIGIVFMDLCPIKNEILKWVASAGVTIITFVICVWIKSMMSGNDSPDTIEKNIKELTRKNMETK